MTANFTMLWLIMQQVGTGWIGNTPNAAQLDYFTMEACVRAGEQLKADFAKQNVGFRFACVERYTR